MCLAFTEGNYEACQSLTEDYLKTHPVTVDFLALKAFCQVKKNELTSALETLDEALTLNNKIKSLWTLSGITYYRLGLVSDSFLCFSKAISLNPDSVHEWFNFSLIFSSKQPEVFKKIQQKIKRMKRFNDEHQLDFFFPSIDFSEFGKRKSEFVPKPFKDLEIVFVMPKVKKVKKVSFKCTSEDRHINSLASVLQGFKKKSKGLKKNRVESTLIPVKRKRKE
jgi:tetratricopeptide (TPR) repeat protein